MKMLEFIRKFNTELSCQQYLAKMRWGRKIACPYCKHTRIYQFKDGLRYKCASCQKRFNAKTGTIFQNTKVPLPKWFLACYLLTGHKKGISSMQLSRDISVTQKTAWKMLHTIRSIFTDKEILAGIVEIDEAYIGGKEKNKHKNKRQPGTQGRSLVSKVPVVGLLQRGGNVRAFHIPNVQLKTIKSIIVANIEPKSRIMTDEYKVYRQIPGFKHEFCNHSAKKYVDGEIHCNGMENFWSLVKRAIIGIYHWVSKKYLQLYLNEFCFRYNTRGETEQKRVDILFGMV